ncbi:hypothetical protein A2Y85_08375 [candidate division WOR-3 bacterium RBG_13_43_14]|uniref:GTPase Der C-terminal KH-domain-like domain-containing protein n=1 Tax=candidate division WOR-3 bacterium RBG_13_43_14 TaxID=1802590 RepID=A0A1F4UE80_UNCW3|nr:MAG: hypothetical protein A2Y85_08375 [candidate division WOR-3 bacterium RBG_13_43_14]
MGKKDISKAYRATTESFSGFEFVPIVPISARKQSGIDTLLKQVIRVYEEMRKYADRHVLQELTRNLKPPVAGAILRINQIAIKPPIFKVRITRSVDASYIKYLRHALRNHFGYTGAPILIRTEKVSIKKTMRMHKE